MYVYIYICLPKNRKFECSNLMGGCSREWVRCGQFGWSTPSSLSGEDSCFVVRQKGVFPTGPYQR